ncbi:MAG: Spx/MgsR family RNA polymerase-binding regulatory protein [Cytophagaceae bacterium]|nr:Spx/MgsR family RNA polymerase-binding regulatory protein [Cytophagaceae bacterium]
MLTVYGIPACNTMKKTFEFLEAKGIEYTFHNYKKEGITEPILQGFIDTLGLEKVFNKQGSTYRQLPDETKASLAVNSAAFSFLLEKNSAIKRPILTDGKRMIAGFNPDELDKWLNV